ncbi:MAG: serine/threonine protein kinase, partial [Thermoanaerobaculia bacterium]
MSESLDELFGRALDLDAGERARLLAEVAAEDPARAERLAALLRAAAGGTSPLDSDPWASLEAEESAEEEALPDRIGPYRVLSELGRGGMGRVYLALQVGDGFERRLAVKVVVPEGDRPDIERRFRQERGILARLDHPGIARFHDAGRDDAGRWYLALEYVEGSNLIDYARERRLATAERLRLFLAVLEATAYAHSRAIVHRDLKPSNILVGADGRPRLLDFGIAKLLDGDPSISATQTQTSFRALTPAYASPEQVRGEPVSTASDVFSLGVVLYELLSGVRPFRGDRDSRSSLERRILETDPEPPSTASRRAAV